MAVTRIFLISQSSVSRLKQRARVLKREEQIPHHEALEVVATAAGYDSWHQVAEAAEQCRPVEHAYRKGFLMAFDASEVPDVDDEESPIKYEPYAFELLRDQLFESYCAQVDEEDPDQRPISEYLDADELEERFEEDWGSMCFFRLREPTDISSVEQLLSLVSKQSFWMPWFVFARGRLVDTYGQPAIDENGEAVGLRF